jgi:hypothetical protein
MSVNYGTLKSMKTAKIGTIMIWGGDGNQGNLGSNVPKGWILCDGTVYPASRFPLLTSVIGNSYGGSEIAGQFPHYSGTSKVPNISSKCMMDLEPSMLNQTTYQYGQSDAFFVVGNLIVDDGLSVPIPTLISADTNLSFEPLPSSNFIGKMTDITLSPPNFQTTVYTVARKLSINHMPFHNHPGFYTGAATTGTAPAVYEPSSMGVGGNRQVDGNCGLLGWTEITFNNIEQAETWCGGKMPVTYYDEDTLVTTDSFRQFISTQDKSYSSVPSLTATARVLDTTEYTDAFSSIPKTTHAQPTWEGLFPRPIVTANRRNYFGYNTGIVGATGLQDDPETVAVVAVATTIVGASTFVTLPAGADLGTNYDKIVPGMLIKSATTTGVYIPATTQIVSVERLSGTSPANYVYRLELSQNIFGTGSVNTSVIISHGTFPTTLNTTESAQDPSLSALKSHNHGSFDITMSVGSLQGPTTHPVNNVSIGNVSAETITGALNIIANVANPSLNIVYIIRAY